MILLSVQLSDSRSVHVRTDDLDPENHEQIGEAMQIVTRMRDRYGLEVLPVIVGMAMLLGAPCVAIGTGDRSVSWLTWLTIVAASGAMIAMLGWAIVFAIIRGRQSADAKRLQALARASCRCREFIAECVLMSPIIARAYDVLPASA